MCAYGLISFKEDNTTTLVTSSKIVTSMVKLDGGDDISYRDRNKRQQAGGE
jgi:hypothetical protein